MEGQLYKISVAPGHQNLQLRREFIEHLPAGAAGPAIIGAAPRHGQPDPIVPMPLADRLEKGGALGADGGAEGRVFHVAACEHRAVGAKNGRAHGKAGIGHIGKMEHIKCLLHQFLIGHGLVPPLIIYFSLILSQRSPSGNLRGRQRLTFSTPASGERPRPKR
ncbi:hypothetical protein SDC9_179745 [bioreactor metagenome]|uniref:Uncharacterized protein n=1 Tax=bioreactor metagenome TaxID=1076179 RepID=A0A645GZQ5_9ZZZZ